MTEPRPRDFRLEVVVVEISTGSVSQAAVDSGVVNEPMREKLERQECHLGRKAPIIRQARNFISSSGKSSLGEMGKEASKKKSRKTEHKKSEKYWGPRRNGWAGAVTVDRGSNGGQ